MPGKGRSGPLSPGDKGSAVLAYQLNEINERIRADAPAFLAECDEAYQKRVEAAADAGARAGLLEGDVIISVANVDIQNVREFEAAVAKADRSKPINMLVQRGELVQFVLVRPPR